jgi:hypothetical protein
MIVIQMLTSGEPLQVSFPSNSKGWDTLDRDRRTKKGHWLTDKFVDRPQPPMCTEECRQFTGAQIAPDHSTRRGTVSADGHD